MPDDAVYVTTTIDRATEAALAALTKRFSYIDIGRYEPDASRPTWATRDNEQWEEIAYLAARAALGVTDDLLNHPNPVMRQNLRAIAAGNGGVLPEGVSVVGDEIHLAPGTYITGGDGLRLDGGTIVGANKERGADR